MRVLIAAAVMSTACAPPRLDIAPLAEGEWIVVDASTPRPLMLQMRGPTRAGERTPAVAAPVLRMLIDSLLPVTQQALSVTPGRQTLSLIRVVAAQAETFLTTSGTPRLVRSPTRSDLYVFELDNAIWAFNARHRSTRRLSADQDFDSLSALQRESEVILYWGSNPMWSADGSFIAFLTNRHGVRTATASQGMRVIEMETGTEKDLINTIGASVHTDGVFATEFVYSSSTAPGVFAVEPRTGTTRRFGDGFVTGFDEHGRAVLLNESGRLTLVHPRGRDTLPAADSGFTYTSRASFSPSSRRVAMFSTNDRGAYALHVYDRRNSAMYRASVPGGPSYGPAWASETEVIFAAASPAQPLTTYRAKLR